MPARRAPATHIEDERAGHAVNKKAVQVQRLGRVVGGRAGEARRKALHDKDGVRAGRIVRGRHGPRCASWGGHWGGIGKACYDDII